VIFVVWFTQRRKVVAKFADVVPFFVFFFGLFVLKIFETCLTKDQGSRKGAKQARSSLRLFAFFASSLGVLCVNHLLHKVIIKDYLRLYVFPPLKQVY